MAKAKKPNEIREEMRKQMAAKYKQDVEHWKKLAHDRWENYMDATKRLADMNDENAKLKEQIEAQKEWIERLMEFVNMPAEQRGAAVNACAVTAEDIKEATDRIITLARGHHIRNADGTVKDVSNDPNYECKQ